MQSFLPEESFKSTVHLGLASRKVPGSLVVPECQETGASYSTVLYSSMYSTHWSLDRLIVAKQLCFTNTVGSKK